MNVEELLAEMAEHGLDGYNADTRMSMILKTCEFVCEVVLPVIRFNALSFGVGITTEWDQLENGDPQHLDCLVAHIEEYQESLQQWKTSLTQISERVTMLQDLAKSQMESNDG